MELHDDDKPIGRVLTRREMLTLLGGAGAALIVGTGFKNLSISQTGTSTATPAATSTAVPSCVVKPALTEGPYFVDEMLNRSDIRIDPSDNSIQDGMLFNLIFNVSDVSNGTCAPLKNAQIDIWHCNALGRYSDVSDPGFDTSGQKWLRGYQVTDEFGMAQFITIVPGWYSGRAVHIHFKIRTDPDSDTGYEFTSQLFFDEATIAKIYAEKPYVTRGVTPDTSNEEDGIFQGSEGLLTLELVENQDKEVGGYVANFGIGLDLDNPPTESGGPGGGGFPGGNPPGGSGGNRPGGRR